VEPWCGRNNPDGVHSPARRPALIALVALALALRLVPIDHGMPRPYVPDSHMVRSALGMLRDKNPVPPVGRYSSYPYLVPYLLLPIYAAEYAVGRATGAWAGAGEFGVRATLHPRLTALPARALIAVLGALTAGVVVMAGMAAGLRRGAWAAGWLVATCLLHVQFSTQERPWVALLFFGALCLWAAIVHERDGRSRSLLASGAAAGLAFGCHQAGAVFLGLCGLAWAFAPGGWSGSALKRRLAWGVGCVALFAVVSLFLGHPYYLVHGGVPQEAVVGGERAAGELSVGGQALRFGFSHHSFAHLSHALAGYDPVLLLLGLAGLVPLWFARGTRSAATFAVAAAAFFMTSPSDHVRYLLPVCLLLALAGGMAVERIATAPLRNAAIALILALPLLQAVRFDVVLARADTRALAEQKLAELPAGARVAIDHYGPAVDLSQAALERLVQVRPKGELRTRERVRLELLQSGALGGNDPGVDAIFVEDLFGVDPTGAYGVQEQARALGSSPREVLAALGATHLLLVERRPGDPSELPLSDLAEGRKVVWTLSPAPGGALPKEAFLPTEMDFPLSALWAVERPGPFLRLIQLAPVED
jgi:hypothetical protein